MSSSDQVVLQCDWLVNLAIDVCRAQNSLNRCHYFIVQVSFTTRTPSTSWVPTTPCPAPYGIIVIAITFASLALEGVDKKLGL